MKKRLIAENGPVSLAGNKKIKILGRHSEEGNALLFDWSGSGVAFNFEGEGFILSLGNTGRIPRLI